MVVLRNWRVGGFGQDSHWKKNAVAADEVKFFDDELK